LLVSHLAQEGQLMISRSAATLTKGKNLRKKDRRSLAV